ncbi:MAG: MFS transporter [Dehalococcoidia bacterium]|nr:MFS transporter [Dehalococcoidia bacterium]
MRGFLASAPGESPYAANVRKFYLFRFLVTFQLWLPIWVLYLTDFRNLSLTEVTILEAAFWLVLVTMELPTGIIADRWGRKVSLSYGAVANAAAIIVFAFAANYGIILVSYLVWGIGLTLFSGADSAFFFDSLKAMGREHEYQKLYGRSWAMQSLGTLAGLLLGAPFAALTNLQTPIILSGLLMLAAWLVSLTFVEPPRHDEGEHGLGALANARHAAGIVYRAPALRWFMLLAAVILATLMCVSIFAQPFLGSHGVAVGAFGLFLLPGSVAGMFGALFLHRVTGWLGTNRTFVLLVPLAALPALGLALFDTIWAWAFYPLNSLAYALTFPLVSDYLNQRIPSSQRATILSMHQLLYSLVLVPLEPLAGLTADAWGLPAAYAVAGTTLAIPALPLLFIWRRALRNESAVAAVPVPAAAPT